MANSNNNNNNIDTIWGSWDADEEMRLFEAVEIAQRCVAETHVTSALSTSQRIVEDGVAEMRAPRETQLPSYQILPFPFSVSGTPESRPSLVTTTPAPFPYPPSSFSSVLPQSPNVLSGEPAALSSLRMSLHPAEENVTVESLASIQRPQSDCRISPSTDSSMAISVHQPVRNSDGKNGISDEVRETEKEWLPSFPGPLTLPPTPAHLRQFMDDESYIPPEQRHEEEEISRENVSNTASSSSIRPVRVGDARRCIRSTGEEEHRNYQCRVSRDFNGQLLSNSVVGFVPPSKPDNSVPDVRGSTVTEGWIDVSERRRQTRNRRRRKQIKKPKKKPRKGRKHRKEKKVDREEFQPFSMSTQKVVARLLREEMDAVFPDK